MAHKRAPSPNHPIPNHSDADAYDNVVGHWCKQGGSLDARIRDLDINSCVTSLGEQEMQRGASSFKKVCHMGSQQQRPLRLRWPKSMLDSVA